MKPFFADSGSRNAPPLEEQRGFWNQWNRTWRFRDLDTFMERQAELVLDVAKRLGLSDARILDVGCGTGWLGNKLVPFGAVCGTDLSEDAIIEGRTRHPGMQLLSGDFLTLELPEPFDFVLCADSLINMYDQPGCVRRLASVLKPEGTLLLMVPNREVWLRRTALKPLGHGQVQRWLSSSEYMDLLRPYFTIERVTTIDPGGNKGLLWWVENRYVRGGMGLVMGRRRWRSLLEAARLGRELVVIARRKPG